MSISSLPITTWFQIESLHNLRNLSKVVTGISFNSLSVVGFPLKRVNERFRRSSLSVRLPLGLLIR